MSDARTHQQLSKARLRRAARRASNNIGCVPPRRRTPHVTAQKLSRARLRRAARRALPRLPGARRLRVVRHKAPQQLLSRARLRRAAHHRTYRGRATTAPRITAPVGAAPPPRRAQHTTASKRFGAALSRQSTESRSRSRTHPPIALRSPRCAAATPLPTPKVTGSHRRPLKHKDTAAQSIGVAPPRRRSTHRNASAGPLVHPPEHIKTAAGRAAVPQPTDAHPRQVPDSSPVTTVVPFPLAVHRHV